MKKKSLRNLINFSINYKMRKEIKQWGDSAVIVLTREDLKLYGLQIGDIVELDDIVKIQKEGKKR